MNEFADVLADSYHALVGEPLVPIGLRGLEAAEWLYEAPFGLLAHDTAPDPLFTYANLTAQQLFGYTWDEFLGLPSRLSAGTQDQESRRIFMDSVRLKGFAENYRGPRVTKDGRAFWIEDVTIWNLRGADGTPAGQAALIRRWT
ncbi:MEKHLA domain-containing protein [Catenuloplanes japonicus]|uniref:MEKHLA domain-containing protein n=1 Tax=Catenuloplanes japonicus TaxID=33876 RepID=UPI000524D97D|nr:MEKHLA domain-containing protein [Catenuloplanes japonicus]